MVKIGIIGGSGLDDPKILENAKEILRDKAKKEDKYYKDAKYVKMAGNTAYNGLLVALDGLFGIKRKGRKSVDWYQQELGKVDKKILTSFNIAYEALHLVMGYDGVLSAKIAAVGLEEAEQIINWVETKQELVAN